MPPVTQRQIAASLGVSTMTVSRALRGVGYTSADLLERIRAKASASRYQTNAIARSLRYSGHSSKRITGLNLGLVMLGPKLQDEAEILRAIVARTKSCGHHLTIFHTSEWRSLSALERIWRARGIVGLFINVHRHNPDRVSRALITSFDWSRLVGIKLGNGLPELTLNRVRYSVFTQMMTTYEQVVAAGYRRILFIVHASTSRTDDQMRLGAMLAAQAQAKEGGVTVNHWLLDAGQNTWANLNSPANVAALRARLIAFRPQAVIGFGPVIHSWLLHLGFSPPASFAYASPTVAPSDSGHVAGTLDDLVGGEFAAALTMMEDQLARGQRGAPLLVQEHTVPVQWTPGSTLPGLGPGPAEQSLSGDLR